MESRDLLLLTASMDFIIPFDYCISRHLFSRDFHSSDFGPPSSDMLAGSYFHVTGVSRLIRNSLFSTIL
jgi:hypothetical protein